MTTTGDNGHEGKAIMNFRDEREHDKRLMELVKALDQAGHLDVLETGLSLPTLGGLSNMQRRLSQHFESRSSCEEYPIPAGHCAGL